MFRSILTGAIVSGLAVASARAGFQVETYSESYIEASGADFANAYNLSGNVGLNSVNVEGRGYHTYGGSGASGGGNPTDTVGNALSSQVYSNAQSVITPSFGSNPVTVNASASAKAILASGSIGIAGVGDYLSTGNAGSGQAGGSGHGFAQGSDVLHFTVAGANGSTVTNIPITFTVNGSFSIATAAGDSSGSLEAVLGVSGASFDQTVSSNSGNAYTPTVGAPTISGWVSSGFSSDTPGHIVFNGVFSITGPTADVSLQETLSGGGAIGTGIDYIHTASLAINNPAGVSYTSDSGVFDTVPAPEPASGALVMGLLAGVSLRRRRS